MKHTECRCVYQLCWQPGPSHPFQFSRQVLQVIVFTKWKGSMCCCNMLQYYVAICCNMFHIKRNPENVMFQYPLICSSDLNLFRSHDQSWLFWKNLIISHRSIGPLARNGYGSIAIDTIFSGLFTSINPSYDLGFTARYQGAMKKSPNGGSDWDSVHQTDLRNRPVVFAGRTGVRPLGMDSDGAPKSKKNTGKTPWE